MATTEQPGQPEPRLPKARANWTPAPRPDTPPAGMLQPQPEQPEQPAPEQPQPEQQPE